MELDFTRLNSLGKTKNSTDQPTEGGAEGEEGINKLQREADRKRIELDRYLAVYKEYQQNIKTSSKLQTELIEGMRAGEDMHILFLKAVKAISLMTSNALFYTQIEADMQAIYGEGLQQLTPLTSEFEATKKRLAKLEMALSRELDQDDRERIVRAIKVHQVKVERLKNNHGEHNAS